MLLVSSWSCGLKTSFVRMLFMKLGLTMQYTFGKSFNLVYRMPANKEHLPKKYDAYVHLLSLKQISAQASKYKAAFVEIKLPVNAQFSAKSILLLESRFQMSFEKSIASNKKE